MKYTAIILLVLLLFVAATGVGQDSLKILTGHELEVQRHRVDSMWASWGRYELLVGLWDSYKAECWADSTPETATYRQFVRLADTVKYQNRHWEKIDEAPEYAYFWTKDTLSWNHKPYYFEGFMEFLRLRLK